ncbi:hypothetical protein [Spiroplasma endosymbiont of Asaphidion curtum]|uniref:hypothetical protein n=1 Tax=Spiroplasma endosymbiont of Asaphidion curtum TaxID=3066281 RepID=UPI00313CEDE0
MRKFLSALNLVCVLFIFGCRSNVYEKKLQFSSLNNTFFNVESFGSAGRITFYDESVRFPGDMSEKSFLIENQSINNPIKDFFKQEGVYKPKPSEDILTTYGWEIPKLESIKVSFVYLDRYQLNKPQYFISSFLAKIPN